uniref:Uncharacterized protein n=1 Tax=Astyanax mexicanus TaxID=7994 RepID=A0A3B1JU09_ASTMX
IADSAAGLSTGAAGLSTGAAEPAGFCFPARFPARHAVFCNDWLRASRFPPRCARIGWCFILANHSPMYISYEGLVGTNPNERGRSLPEYRRENRKKRTVHRSDSWSFQLENDKNLPEV